RGETSGWYGDCANIKNVFYEPTDGRIYAMEGADTNERPVIHVWQVGALAPSFSDGIQMTVASTTLPTTSGGTFDIQDATIAALPAEQQWTPKAAIITITGGTVDGTARDGALLAYGATDGVRQWSVAILAPDASTTATAPKSRFVTSS